MARNDFLSDNLVHIRDRLKAYSTGENTLPGSAAPAREENTAPESAGRNSALTARVLEARKLRRELAGLLARELAENEAMVERQLRRAEQLRSSIVELEALPEEPAGEDPASVGNYFRSVEIIRLGYLRDKGQEAPEADAVTGGGISTEELLSISLKQWWRIGLGLSLPLIAAVGVAAIMVTLGILIGMGVIG